MISLTAAMGSTMCRAERETISLLAAPATIFSTVMATTPLS